MRKNAIKQISEDKNQPEANSDYVNSSLYRSIGIKVITFEKLDLDLERARVVTMPRKISNPPLRAN